MRLKTRYNAAQCERHAQQGSLGSKSRQDWSYKGRKNKHGPVRIIEGGELLLLLINNLTNEGN